MITILAVGAGGFLGSIARYLANRGVYQVFETAWLPYSTLLVNVSGCLVIGILSGAAEKWGVLNSDNPTRAFVLIGFLGGFTTFSAFGYESFAFLRGGQVVQAFANVGLQVILGIGAVWLGYRLTILGS